MIAFIVRRLLRSALLVLAAVGSACAAGPSAPPPAAPGGDRLIVLTSVTVLADLIRQVGAERVEVRPLVPSGADPFTFQPAPRTVLDVGRAKLAIFNGLGLERTVRPAVANANRPELPIVVLSDGLPTQPSRVAAPEPGAGAPRGNPYLWLDPRLAAVYVGRIADSLARVDPGQADVFRANAAAYTQRLERQDAEVQGQLQAIPPARRKLLSLHDAFPYFAARYDFELAGVVMKTPGRAPSAQEVAEVARTIRGQEVPAVFIEPQLDARLLKLAARDAGVRIGTLYSDTLDQFVPSYEALLGYNARQLVNGLR